MSLLRGPGRGRAFFRFLGAVGWLLVTYYLANRAAHGFSHGAAFPLIRNLFQIFMLIVGFGYMELAWDGSREPIRAMGLPSRPGAAARVWTGRRAGLGNGDGRSADRRAGGTFLCAAVDAPRAWGLLIVQLLTLLAGALAGEIAFRGYPFQKLVETVGPVRRDDSGSHYFRSAASDDAGFDSDSRVDQRGGSDFVIGGLLENPRTVAGLGIALCVDREHWHSCSANRWRAAARFRA